MVKYEKKEMGKYDTLSVGLFKMVTNIPLHFVYGVYLLLFIDNVCLLMKVKFHPRGKVEAELRSKVQF